jgi:four helix bundle protein
MAQLSNKYDLEERTAIFGEDVIKFCKTIELNTINRPIISQIVRSATSIGANYCEANNSSSKKDFRNKIFICKKETQETKHWLRMLNSCVPERKEELKKLWQEAQELSMIFQKIISSLNKTIEN